MTVDELKVLLAEYVIQLADTKKALGAAQHTNEVLSNKIQVMESVEPDGEESPKLEAVGAD